jgi:hypothetical protein
MLGDKVAHPLLVTVHSSSAVSPCFGVLLTRMVVQSIARGDKTFDALQFLLCTVEPIVGASQVDAPLVI